MPQQTDAKPTVVLVHGAFADGSSWNGVIERLRRHGYTVVAPANPLRGVVADSAYIASVVSQIDGPVLFRDAFAADSHVIMVSQPQAITDHLVKAAQAVAGSRQ
jgi:pimeloyl-ACP methyl ester carboxylesterase